MSTSAEEERVRLAVRLASEAPSAAVILIASHAEDDLAELVAASPSVVAFVASERRDR
jgi:putative heme iron utilization protein